MTTALIVEDEALSAMLLERGLAANGVRVLKPVPTGEDAVRVALSERPEVILMDIRLAGEMDGIEAAGIIMKTYRFKLIFMTGYQDGELYDRAMALKPLCYLTKPVFLESVLELL